VVAASVVAAGAVVAQEEDFNLGTVLNSKQNCPLPRTVYERLENHP